MAKVMFERPCIARSRTSCSVASARASSRWALSYPESSSLLITSRPVATRFGRLSGCWRTWAWLNDSVGGVRWCYRRRPLRPSFKWFAPRQNYLATRTAANFGCFQMSVWRWTKRWRENWAVRLVMSGSRFPGYERWGQTVCPFAGPACLWCPSTDQLPNASAGALARSMKWLPRHLKSP